VVASIDEVVVNDGHAEANVTSFMAFDPSTFCPCGSRLHLAVNPYDPFGTHLFGRLEGRRGRVNDDLGQAIMIAKIDEQKAAMVSHPVNPAGKADVLALVVNSKLATGVAPVGVRHGRNVPQLARKSAWGP
jgi:hypothetical protein